MKSVVLAFGILLFNFSNLRAQWTKITSVPSQQIVALAAYGDTILAASGRNLIYKGTDNGSIWTPVTVTTENASITYLYIIDNEIYAGTSTNGIFFSSGNSLSWIKLGANLLSISGIEKRGTDLYASTLGDGVLKYNQNTDSWIPFNNSLPTYSVNVFAFLNSPGTLLIGAGANGTVYRYDFNNSQWTEVLYYGLLKPGLIIYKLLGFSNTIFAVNGDRIIRSDNDGVGWADDKTGSHDGISRNIYSGSSRFLTITNLLNGGTWIQERNKFSSPGSDWSVNEEFIPTGYSEDILEFKNRLYLAKRDGLYVRDQVLGSGNTAAGSADAVIFPNPSDGTKISISCARLINKLSIYNMLGQIRYSIIVNGKELLIRPDLGPGVYFVNLKMSDGVNIIRKIIIE